MITGIETVEAIDTTRTIDGVILEVDSCTLTLTSAETAVLTLISIDLDAEEAAT